MTERVPTEDEATFGPDTWVYCDQHRRPHTTGWCTVPARNKTRLEATTVQSAQDECRARGFRLFGDNQP